MLPLHKYLAYCEIWRRFVNGIPCLTDDSLSLFDFGDAAAARAMFLKSGHGVAAIAATAWPPKPRKLPLKFGPPEIRLASILS